MPSRSSLRFASLGLPALLVLGACGGSPAPDPEAGTEGDTIPSDTGVEADTAANSDSDSGSDSGSDSDSGSGSGSGTGEPADSICVDEDPAISASTMVDWSEWPEEEDVFDVEFAVEIDAPCTITAVDPTADPVVTVLECDDDGVTRGLELTVAAADAPVAWDVGDAVEVSYSRAEYSDGYGTLSNVLSMRRAADGEVLLRFINEPSVGAFTPLIFSVDDERCLPEETHADLTWNLVLTFANGLGEVLELGHRQRGTITPPSGGGLFAIDVGTARKGADYCCHEGARIHILMRRTVAEQAAVNSPRTAWRARTGRSLRRSARRPW
ncbi:hypothetical protein [Paraliomyxa miuraensis]|uniref:hypothetical protein n=1 Tax=Paraliomyxa miuraensis TaxID=376150 RepID=UPI002259E716|nr:hypothetical protein [Paraliomyxa miuraensis]MCX4246697.1 hypothetical protein [Paraliomyxa miuraensis]